MKSLKHETLPDGRSSKLKNLVEEDLNGSRHIQRGYAPEGQKRRYIAHFVSKLTDSDGEQAETQHWIETAFACEYITADVNKKLLGKCKEIGRMLGSMIASPEKFCKPSGKKK